MVDKLVLHYTDTKSARDALDILCDPEREVSAHYLLDEDGTVYQLVPEARRAWHAGVSFWRGDRDVNSSSIGIEIQNPGERFGLKPFPEVQLSALIPLCRDIIERHRLEPVNVVGHSDIAPGRKRDPGPLFPWARLAAARIGLWPQGIEGDAPAKGLREDLIALGYDPESRDIVAAFQRRYRTACIDNISDGRCAVMAKALLRQAGDRIS